VSEKRSMLFFPSVALKNGGSFANSHSKTAIMGGIMKYTEYWMCISPRMKWNGTSA
jgi:hypothetical protein